MVEAVVSDQESLRVSYRPGQFARNDSTDVKTETTATSRGYSVKTVMTPTR